MTNNQTVSLLQRSEEANRLIEYLDQFELFNPNVEDYVENMFPYAKSFHNKHDLGLDLDCVMDSIYLSWILKKHAVKLAKSIH